LARPRKSIHPVLIIMNARCFAYVVITKWEWNEQSQCVFGWLNIQIPPKRILVEAKNQICLKLIEKTRVSCVRSDAQIQPNTWCPDSPQPVSHLDALEFSQGSYLEQSKT
jgi:hypothetical protein